MSKPIAALIAAELAVRPEQVATAVKLLDEGATVPFIARYRKEATAGLDDTQLRSLQERLRYLRKLDDRRETVLAGIERQKKLTPELQKAIRAAQTQVELEDLYRPYKPRRQSKAQAARKAGLDGLAQSLVEDPSRQPTAAAAPFARRRGVKDAAAALKGAREILVEEWSDHPPLVRSLREELRQKGLVQGIAKAGSDYGANLEAPEPLGSMPSHRALALLRAVKEGSARVQLVDGKDRKPVGRDARGSFTGAVSKAFGIEDKGRPADRWLHASAKACWKKLASRLETELLADLRESAERQATQVFAENLRDLLLGPTAGARPIIGLDPGLRTGVKVAVVGSTGKVLETATIYPHPPRNAWQNACKTVMQLCRRHGVKLVGIGNGTGSRETDRLIRELIHKHPAFGLQKVVVSEAGASVYSASELAARELPDLDVSLRGAVSIARRLQDPLAELVKIDPRALGIGQYQHDVDQGRLSRALDIVVEDCVNTVGVDVNTASAPLLERVAGLNTALARNIVAWRDKHGPFQSRKQLLEVPRLGPKVFEQCAGFLRIRGGAEPLDASAVHPEAYSVARRMARAAGVEIRDLIGNRAALGTLDPKDFATAKFGLPTVTDILAELEKPGRDPRPVLKTAAFAEGIEDIADLEPGMNLEGVVSNVTQFGAFVDVGVHHDGLVHISQLGETFVKDPHEVVKPGDIVNVTVVDVDLDRKRIGLTMRRGEWKAAAEARRGAGRRARI